MQMRLIPLLLCLLLCKTYAFSQSADYIEIEGEILESESGAPVPYVHIMNHNSGFGTVSNTEGRFWIKMMAADTLLFSAIGYETYAFTLQPDQRSRRLRVSIELNTSTQVLRPVNVFAYRDEESLKQALIEMDIPNIPEEQPMVLPGVRTGPLDGNPSITLGGPISFFYNKFSRQAKASKKLQSDIIAYDYRKVLRAKYNEDVVMELTGLPEDRVEEFMNFCKIDEAFIYKSNEYEIALAVNNCLKDFNAAEKE